jgi:hypothetical protein
MHYTTYLQALCFTIPLSSYHNVTHETTVTLLTTPHYNTRHHTTLYHSLLHHTTIPQLLLKFPLLKEADLEAITLKEQFTRIVLASKSIVYAIGAVPYFVDYEGFNCSSVLFFVISVHLNHCLVACNADTLTELQTD